MRSNGLKEEQNIAKKEEPLPGSARRMCLVWIQDIQGRTLQQKIQT